MIPVPQTYSRKNPEERVFISVDFTLRLNRLPPGTTINNDGSARATIGVASGADPDPQAIVDGPVIVDGVELGVWAINGVDLVDYVVDWYAECSDGSKIDSQWILPVRSKLYIP